MDTNKLGVSGANKINKGEIIIIDTNLSCQITNLEYKLMPQHYQV